MPDQDQLLVRFRRVDGTTGWGVRTGDGVVPLPYTLDVLCAVPVEVARDLVERALDQAGDVREADTITLLAPVDAQDVWAAGVTYERSRDARIEESGAEDLYGRIYAADRPELFMKATGPRAVGPDAAVGIRADATWSVPEPELAVILNAAGETLGFTVGNDMSSRDLEGANALYLPQAKIYDNACALGPAIRPAWTVPDDHDFAITLTITRDGDTLFQGDTTTARLRRRWQELGRWLTAALTFPSGVVLLTGTGIVPGPEVSLQPHDDIAITIAGIGTLRNPVALVGAPVGELIDSSST
jgi:2-dehydro-3-deoxy-D-arabinonate dehydratase